MSPSFDNAAFDVDAFSTDAFDMEGGGPAVVLPGLIVLTLQYPEVDFRLPHEAPPSI